MNKEEIQNEVACVENRLLNEILTVVMYLNKNGVPLNVVHDMIDSKVEHAFDAYEKIRDEYDDIIHGFRGF